MCVHVIEAKATHREAMEEMKDQSISRWDLPIYLIPPACPVLPHTKQNVGPPLATHPSFCTPGRLFSPSSLSAASRLVRKTRGRAVWVGLLTKRSRYLAPPFKIEYVREDRRTNPLPVLLEPKPTRPSPHAAIAPSLAPTEASPHALSGQPHTFSSPLSYPLAHRTIHLAPSTAST